MGTKRVGKTEADRVVEAVELTTFRLSEGVTFTAFIEANADVDVWLQQQQGFVLRRIFQDANGLVTDMLLWKSSQDGERAARGILTELAHSPVHASIDQSSVSWSVNACRHSLN